MNQVVHCSHLFETTSRRCTARIVRRGGIDSRLHPRSFTSLSQAEEENGQSRIYLGIHWSFDKTEGITQGRKVARFVARNAFGPK